MEHVKVINKIKNRSMILGFKKLNKNTAFAAIFMILSPQRIHCEPPILNLPFCNFDLDIESISMKIRFYWYKHGMMIMVVR